MSSALLPGTETTMLFVPCCCTLAPVKPCPLTRLFKMAIDWDISELVGAGLPGVSTTVLSVTVVPLDRSRPRPTLNLLCQSPGCSAAPPMIVPSMTISSAAGSR